MNISVFEYDIADFIVNERESNKHVTNPRTLSDILIKLQKCYI